MSEPCHFELRQKLVKRRSLGSDHADELRSGPTVLGVGTTSGRMLGRPATLACDRGEFTLRPVTKLPHRWTATWATGERIADFALSRLGCGRTESRRIPESLFAAADPALVDLAKATVVLHSDSFHLTSVDGRLLAITGRRKGRSVGRFVREIGSVVRPASHVSK